jgi:hypothetical protein
MCKRWRALQLAGCVRAPATAADCAAWNYPYTCCRNPALVLHGDANWRTQAAEAARSADAELTMGGAAGTGRQDDQSRPRRTLP